MKRLFALLLCAMMLLPLFTGCTGGSIRASGKRRVDMEGFAVVYPSENTTATFRAEAKRLAAQIEAMSGVPVTATDESRLRSDVQKLILLGETKNEASAKAKESIKGDGFAVRTEETQIVVVGSTPAMTMYAVQYLCNEVLTEPAENTTLTWPKRIRANKLPTVELANAEQAHATLIYEEGLDTQRDDDGTYETDAHYDYPYAVLKNALGALRRVTELAEREFPVKADTAAPVANEIIFGLADRPEVQECLDTIPDTSAGVFVKNGKTVVTARSDTALSVANELFLDLIADATVADTAAVRLPEGLALTGECFAGYITDFPKPEGLPLYNMQDAGDGALQYLYMGEGVDADAFRTYCSTLTSATYRKYSENEIEGSLFASFVNDKEKITLYVAYNAFTHGKNEYDYEPRLRVVAASTKQVNLFDESVLAQAPAYEKKTDSVISALALEQDNVGMGYVMLLEDGRFVILDGGRADESAARLWQMLTAMHKRVYGEDTTKPIHIAAWVITHSHGDHYETFLLFCEQHKNDAVQIDYLLGNFPAKMPNYNAFGPEANFTEKVKGGNGIFPGCKYVRIHTGERYYFANLEIEVLCTQEDVNPLRIEIFNDTSCTLRFTMCATDVNGTPVADDAATVTSIWAADSYVLDSRFMTAMYGDYLRSDMVQVAHHGNIGCESPFYRCIRPTAIWFPHVHSAFLSYTDGHNTKSWQNVVDHDLVFGIGTVAYAFVSDVNCVALPLRASGADYAGIFDAITGEPIAYKNYDDRVAAGAIKIS